MTDESRQKVLTDLVDGRHRRAQADRLRAEIEGLAARSSERRDAALRNAEATATLDLNDGLSNAELRAERQPSPATERLARELDVLHRAEAAPPVEPAVVDEPHPLDVQLRINADRRAHPTTFRGS